MLPDRVQTIIHGLDLWGYVLIQVIVSQVAERKLVKSVENIMVQRRIGTMNLLRRMAPSC